MIDMGRNRAQRTPRNRHEPKLAAMRGTRAVGYHQGQRTKSPHQQAGQMTEADQADQTVKALAKRPSTYDG
jgi:hypothetical protein